MDLYLFNTVINTIWYIFTILFVLYKFTSFFSYIYNFIKFCGKVFTWIKYIYDQIVIYLQKKRGYKYTLLNNLESQTTQTRKTYFQKIKENILKSYIKLKLYFGFSHKQQPLPQHFGTPLTEIVSNSNIKNQSYYNSSEQNCFNSNLDELDESSILFNYLNDEIDNSVSERFNVQHSEHSEDSYNSDNLINLERSKHTNDSENSDKLINYFSNPNLSNFNSNNTNLSNFNSNIIPLDNNYNIDSHTSIINTFSEKQIDRPYDVNNSNLLFNSKFILNSIKQSTRENETAPYLFEFQNDKIDKKINLNKSICVNEEKKKDIYNFDKEITKNPYI
jgi:hypothetical protein